MEVTRLLLERGVDVTAKDTDGWTPLHYAARGDRVEILRLLLERGADATTRANDGQTPLDMASCREATRVLEHHVHAIAQGHHG